MYLTDSFSSRFSISFPPRQNSRLPRLGVHGNMFSEAPHHGKIPSWAKPDPILGRLKNLPRAIFAIPVPLELVKTRLSTL